MNDELGTTIKAGRKPRSQVSISISRAVFEQAKKVYEEKKFELFKNENIRTFTSYVKKRLEESVLEDMLEGRFEILSMSDNEIEVRDHFLGKDVTLEIRIMGPYAAMFCKLDRTGNCQHVGFILSDQKTATKARDMGVVLRRAPKSRDISYAAELFKKFAGEDEISDAEFAQKVAQETELDELEARELLRALHQDWKIAVTREEDGRFYIKATDEMDTPRAA